MREVKVVIPWRPEPSREAGLRWVSEYYRHRLGQDCVHIEVDDSSRPFNRSKTINRGVAKFPDATVVIGDADCIICNKALQVAVAEADDKMIIPHDSFCRTTRAQGKWILSKDPREPVSCKWLRSRRSKPATGGLWVIRASLFLDHLMDERFQGWGSEDTEFLRRVPIDRRKGPLFHIWHVKASKRHFRRNKRLSAMIHRQRLEKA